jgi:protein-tyrosine phosphatase
MTADAPPTIGVLFVCHANVCRSPLAAALFRHLARQRGLEARFEVDSAGTNAWEGAPPHPLSVAIAERHGIALSGTSRQLVRGDLVRFDHILLMDRQNREELRRLAGAAVLDPRTGLRAQVRLLRELVDPGADEDAHDVPDPIGQGIESYGRAFELIREGCEALLRHCSKQ